MSERLMCEEFERAIPWFLDDELDSEYAFEFEEHLGHCAHCRARLEAEGRLRLALRRASSTIAAPARLRARLNEAIEQEARARSSWSRRWPAAAAAAILLAFVWKGASGESVEDLQEAAARHARNLPMDVVAADLSQVQSYLSSKLPFAVNIPSPVEKPSTLGGRITQIANRDAAYVRYEVPRGRVSIFVYESPDSSIVEEGPRYRFGQENVMLRRVRGYTAMRWQRNGLVYSVVTDLPEGELSRIPLYEALRPPTNSLEPAQRLPRGPARAPTVMPAALQSHP